MKLALILLLALTLDAHAEKKPSAQAVTAAKAHFKQGAAFYQVGLYDQAIAEYQAAYKVMALPDILFNIGQAYRMRGNEEQAMEYYRRYLQASPNGAASDEVNRQLVELSASSVRAKKAHEAQAVAAEIAAEKARADKAAADKVAAENQAALDKANAYQAAVDAHMAEIARADEDRRHHGRVLRNAGIGITAAGVVGLALGGAFAGLAQEANSQFLNPSNGIYSSDAQEHRGLYQQVDLAMFVVGGAAAVTGLALIVVGNRAAHR